MSSNYQHYGWECSPYSSKTRAYFKYKGIEHTDIYPNIFQMKTIMTKRVGYMIMPVVVGPNNETLQDSSDIIDTLEARFPKHSIVPSTPTQHLVSLLFELFGDEWLPLIAMHTRWNTPENRHFIIGDFGANAVPWLPSFLQRMVVKKVAAKMASYLPVLGITPHTAPAIDAWIEELFDGLNSHFSKHAYLLGDAACLGDFAVYGPLYAHVWRDPGSHALIGKRSHLNQWIQRMNTANGPKGQFLSNDAIPESLWPILQRMFDEQFPVLKQTVGAVEAWLDEHPDSTKIPRGLGKLSFSIGTATEQRTNMSFSQWMLQRPLFYYQSLKDSEKSAVDAFLKKVGGFDAMQITIKRSLTRRNFRVVPA